MHPSPETNATDSNSSANDRTGEEQPVSRIVQIVEDARYQHHRGPEGHPERPERLLAIGEAIDPVRDRLALREPRAADPDELRRVHDARMIDLLATTRERAPGQLDADTYFTPGSYDVASLAAGATIDLARSVLEAESSAGLAAVRPPGHHAEANRSMGFCLFNNVAIAARALQAEGGSPRIAIVDWDVHHGNGTQHSFEDDPEILYLSTHQFPFYPGTGDFAEAGVGAGLGTTVNVPMPAGCGDPEFVGVFARIVTPVLLHFRPDIILVSCGFDAHRDDPLASMDLGIEGFQAMAGILRALAESLCGGRIVYVLEGGYALSGVREGATAVLESLLAPAAPPPPPALQPEPGSTLAALIERVRAVHAARIPDLGAA